MRTLPVIGQPRLVLRVSLTGALTVFRFSCYPLHCTGRCGFSSRGLRISSQRAFLEILFGASFQRGHTSTGIGSQHRQCPKFLSLASVLLDSIELTNKNRRSLVLATSANPIWRPTPIVRSFNPLENSNQNKLENG